MIGRLFKHWVTGGGTVKRLFPPRVLDRIEATITAGEALHSGEICFAIEAAIPLTAVWRGVSPRARALEVFSHLRVWDTEQNCGVLVYLLLADHDVEIVADRGIHARVGEAKWAAICKRMEEQFRAGRFEDGAIVGIEEINTLLAVHFPVGPGDRNELSNRPVLLS